MAATYNFRPHESGDTFSGVTFNLPEAFDLTGAKIELITNINQDVTQLSSERGQIEILSHNSFKIKEQVISWTPRTYRYKIRITFSTGIVKSYITGTWTIT